MERKKLATRRRIQDVALALIRDSSYAAVTVEEIADRSDVSTSTVYRYFGTKEHIILWDEHDDAFLDAFSEQLRTLSPGAAMVESMAGLFGEGAPNVDRSILEHLELIASVPQLRAAAAVRIDELRRTMANAIVGSGWSEPEASTFAGAVVGAVTGAIEAWVVADGTEPLVELLDRTAAVVAVLDHVFSGSSDHRKTRGTACTY